MKAPAADDQTMTVEKFESDELDVSDRFCLPGERVPFGAEKREKFFEKSTLSAFDKIKSMGSYSALLQIKKNLNIYLYSSRN